MDPHCWLLVVNDPTARELARTEWRHLTLAPSTDPRPAPGSCVAVIRTHRPDFIARAVVLGTADVRATTSDALELRHRVVAPSGHEPALAALRLRIAAGWTDERLGHLVGAALPLPPVDEERIEREVLDRAHAFGPAPARPAHHRPRTPGRRALVSARIAARRTTGSRAPKTRPAR